MSSWPGSVSNWCWCSGEGAAAALEGSRGGKEGKGDEAATALLIPQENMEVAKEEGQLLSPHPSPPVSLLGILLLPGVLAAALLVMVSFSSISFLELAFAGHAEAALGLAPLGTGLLFSCVDIAYAACAYLMARARKRGKEGSEGGRKEEEDHRLSGSRRGEGEQVGEERQRTLSRSSSTASSTSSASSSSSSSSRFGFSFLNLRTLALAGLACQALTMRLLGPLPLFSLPLPPFLSPSLLAWLSVACGCLVAGVGEALALVPAVDLMRAALPPSLSLAMSDGSNGGQGATGHLAAVMSAATSLGECVGPAHGGPAPAEEGGVHGKRGRGGGRVCVGLSVDDGLDCGGLGDLRLCLLGRAGQRGGGGGGGNGGRGGGCSNVRSRISPSSTYGSSRSGGGQCGGGRGRGACVQDSHRGCSLATTPTTAPLPTPHAHLAGLLACTFHHPLWPRRGPRRCPRRWKEVDGEAALEEAAQLEIGRTRRDKVRNHRGRLEKSRNTGQAPKGIDGQKHALQIIKEKNNEQEAKSLSLSGDQH